MSKKKIGILFLALLGIGSFLFYFFLSKTAPHPFVLQPTPIPTPLAVYSFEQLRETNFPSVPIRFGHIVKETTDSIAQVFYFTFAPHPGSSETKTVSGVANIPKKPGSYPVIVMLRGYIPPEKYTEGAGTQPSAGVFVRNGFITLAPDFLGFGESDVKAEDQFESRFQTYTTALSLLASIPRINDGLTASYSGQITADVTKIGLWGHSNGGHIALSTLAISGVNYPTVLWAPVSKSFPYSNLVYTDEDDDQGKEYRKDLSDFEKIYDTDLFSPQLYFSWIQAPLQIHQGTSDQEVPFWWSDELVDTLQKQGKDIEYLKYPGSDHNLRPAWNDVVSKSIEFYQRQFSK
ncbi:MAG: prolyl oligopeptidase family serine peptidase [Candidatus Woesebacteria bacterium]